TKQKLIRYSLIFTVLGIILVITGYIIDAGAFRMVGNLLVFTAIMLWFYKYVLSRGVDYFQYKALGKLENNYERFLKFALRKKKSYVFFFGTLGLLIFSFILVGIVQPNVLFFPENQPNQIITYIEFPEGTDIQKTNELTKQVEQRIFESISKYED